jgi:2-isopropylmalate synthase
MPWEVESIVGEIVSIFPGQTIGIHAHNDSGMAVANSLAGIRAGAVHVQGTTNGYGERCGNADLCTIIANLEIKLNLRVLPTDKLSQLTNVSRTVAVIANQSPYRHAPYVGRSAFAHKGGIHVAAMRRNLLSYQHIDPALVGNEARVVVSELSGKGNLLSKADDMGIDPDEFKDLPEVLRKIKEMEHRGFTFEGAEASVEILLQRSREDYKPPFELLDFMAVVEHREGRGMFAEATVKVKVGNEIYHTAAEGNGPVNALDAALRKALVPVYPRLADFDLVDYKVHILDSDTGTAATTRVLIDVQNGTQRWSTVGASTNIIEASWIALMDAVEYGLACTDCGK